MIILWILFIIPVFNSQPLLKVPDIFLIGCAKGGSTSFYELLRQSPSICRTKKEFHFFKHRHSLNEYQQYENAFSNCSTKLSLDATPDYAIRDAVPVNIKASYTPSDLAKKKFILVLREPISREFSWHKMWELICINNIDKNITYTYEVCKKSGIFELNDTIRSSPREFMYGFDEWVEHHPEVYEDSYYAEHIHRWLKVIKRDQLFIVNSDYVQRNTTDVGHRLAAFLDLPGSWQGEVEMSHSNYHPDFTAILPCGVCHKLEQHYRPRNERLYALLRSNELGDRPRSEPEFPRFISNPCSKCIGA